MKILETARRVKDLLIMPRITGEVAAVLPKIPGDEPIVFSRYVVLSNGALIDIRVPEFSTFSYPGFSFATQIPEFKRGDKIDIKVAQAKPWINGQIV